MHQSQSHSNISIQTSITSSHDGDNNNSASEISDISNTLMSEQSMPTCDLASFLIQRACRNPTLANYLYWYLCIECESQETVRKQDEQVKNMYGKVLRTFKRTLMLGMILTDCEAARAMNKIPNFFRQAMQNSGKLKSI